MMAFYTVAAPPVPRGWAGHLQSSLVTPTSGRPKQRRSEDWQRNNIA
jgi:hypothetical protein